MNKIETLIRIRDASVCFVSQLTAVGGSRGSSPLSAIALTAMAMRRDYMRRSHDIDAALHSAKLPITLSKGGRVQFSRVCVAV